MNRWMAPAADALLIAVAYLLAYVADFGGAIPPLYDDVVAGTLPFAVATGACVFARFGLYRDAPGLRGRAAVVAIAGSAAVATLVINGVVALARSFELVAVGGLPARVMLLYPVLLSGLVGARHAATAGSWRRRDAPAVR